MEALLEVPVGTKGHPGGLGGVGILPEVQEGSGGTTRRFGRGRETLPEVREGSGDPPVGRRGVGRPSRKSGRSWKDVL